MGVKSEHVISEMDEYIRVLREAKGTAPSCIYLKKSDYSILKNMSETWGNQLWKSGEHIEYRGIPVKPLSI